MAQAIRRGIQQVAIERMGRKLLELEDKKDVLDLVFRTLRDLERFDGFCLATRRAEGETCRVERAIDLRSGAELPTHSALSADSAYRYVIDSGKVFLPPIFANAGRRPLFEDSQSIIVVPLLGEQSALGIEHREPGRFKIDDLRFLQRLAQWVSLALANIRILRERRRREAEQGLLAHALLHEINNPLNNLAMLAQGGGNLEAKDLEDLVANVSRIRQILKGSLERMQREGDAQPVALDETLEETISRFRYYYPKSGVEIERNFSPGLPAIQGNREMLIYAFMNLIQNGADATEHRGRLMIQADFVPLREQLELAFTDDGRGIAPANLRKVFDYGYTTGGEGHLGQGLALTQEFIQRHGGEITVTSHKGAGSTFRVVFPLRPVGITSVIDASHAEA
jgi:signal transduction histidine kinase